MKVVPILLLAGMLTMTNPTYAFIDEDHRVHKVTKKDKKKKRKHKVTQGNNGFTDLTAPPDSQELRCMASNIHFEAGNQPTKGKIAVANVTINRMKSENYPSSACGVIYQRNKTTCAFSWVCQRGKTYRADQESLQLAKLALSGALKDVTSGATFFHADYVNPRWKGVEKTIKIGDHIFYRKRTQKRR